jgi:hypothetical protein
MQHLLLQGDRGAYRKGGKEQKGAAKTKNSPRRHGVADKGKNGYLVIGSGYLWLIAALSDLARRVIRSDQNQLPTTNYQLPNTKYQILVFCFFSVTPRLRGEILAFTGPN